MTVGFDEAGRGPLAGPVVAGAVILPPDFPVEILNDSKKLSEKKRLFAEALIKEKAMWGIGIVDHKKIDEINILQASLLAMKLAYEDLQERFPVMAGSGATWQSTTSTLKGLSDGNFTPNVPFPCRAEPKADGKYPCVMAASIIAKVCRDRLMLEYDKKYPEYGYARHKGYPTPAHKKICRQLGPSPIQRLSFKV
jgi:ribonuclease HII